MNSFNDEFKVTSQVDGTSVIIDKRSTRLSTLLKHLEEDYQENEIQIPNISGQYLIYIAEYLNHYNLKDPPKVEKPLKIYDISQMYGKWEDQFISEFCNNKKELWELINHANFLGCESLLDLACSKIAVYIKDFSPKKTLEYFGIIEDLTEDEAKKMHIEFEKQLK
jgi:hypothetical protein